MFSVTAFCIFLLISIFDVLKSWSSCSSLEDNEQNNKLGPKASLDGGLDY